MPPTRATKPLSGIFFHGEQFFRFYLDGTFLDVLVRGADDASARAAVSTWLHRDDARAGVRRGRYRQMGSRIAFETQSAFGRPDRSVRYSGAFERGCLRLDVLDENDGRRRVGVVFTAL